MIRESDGRRADGPDCGDAACPNFVHLYILVVNKVYQLKYLILAASGYITLPNKIT